MMRIVTGKAKGKRLATLEGEATRPTGERVKEAIFSSIQFEIEGRRVLDLFAGSGQMGLEALSRGASKATFIDAEGAAMAIIKENATRTGFFADSHFLISDYRSYLRKTKGKEPFDLIFIDPPYAMHCVADALARILEAGTAAPNCLIVCESGDADIFANDPALKNRFEVLKEARYSISYVTILRYTGENADA